MLSKYVLCFTAVFSTLAFSAPVSAQTELDAESTPTPERVSTAVLAPEPDPTTAPAPMEPIAPDPQPTLTLDEPDALGEIQRRSDVAAALYTSSVVLAVTGVGGIIAAPILFTISLVGAPGYALPALITGAAGGLCIIGHIVTMAFAISIDNGVGVRHERYLASSPQVAITGGPGDFGLGLALKL